MPWGADDHRRADQGIHLSPLSAFAMACSGIIRADLFVLSTGVFLALEAALTSERKRSLVALSTGRGKQRQLILFFFSGKKYSTRKIPVCHAPRRSAGSQDIPLS
jgi:hypothetical protein